MSLLRQNRALHRITNEQITGHFPALIFSTKFSMEFDLKTQVSPFELISIGTPSKLAFENTQDFDLRSLAGGKF